MVVIRLQLCRIGVFSRSDFIGARNATGSWINYNIQGSQRRLGCDEIWINIDPGVVHDFGDGHPLISIYDCTLPTPALCRGTTVLLEEVIEFTWNEKSAKPSKRHILPRASPHKYCGQW